ncbi:MAG TPA: TetR/AcrR family transcriptional regulator [Planctomycetota bacterium]|nr:TetR/AcrR family transcriptional regulator [Planctomycetota bacterium]
MKSLRAPRPKAKPRGRPRSFDREAALERAMQVFWRQGYEATSLGDLTSAMRINPPSLYAAFGSKEELFLEAVERYRSGPGALAARVLAEEPTARRAIARLLDEAAAELTREGRPRGCMVVSAAMNCSSDSKHLQTALADERAGSEAVIRARLARAVREGELRRGTDAAALARFYATVLQGMTIQARDGASRPRLRAIGEAAMRAWPR